MEVSAGIFQDIFEEVRIELSRISPFGTRFLFSSLPSGYGTTIGNSLRRVLLSSIEGSALKAVNINNCDQYTAVDGVYENYFQIIENLKKLIFRITNPSKSREFAYIRLDKPGKILAKDIELTSDLELLSKGEEYIAEIVKEGVKLDIALLIERGCGYMEVNEERLDLVSQNYPKSFILLDAFYSPIKTVSFEILNRTSSTKAPFEFEDLALICETNGSKSPEDAVLEAFKIVSQAFTKVMETYSNPRKVQQHSDSRILNETSSRSSNKISVSDLNVSTRLYNSLSKNGIENLNQLEGFTVSQIQSSLKGIGTKTMEELLAILKGYGIKVIDSGENLLIKTKEKKIEPTTRLDEKFSEEANKEGFVDESLDVDDDSEGNRE